jgi:hypothetical protein
VHHIVDVRRILIAAAVALSVGACATTKPWQREDLARKSMAMDPDGERAALRLHFLGIREGAVGGFGGGGGGCGCN